MSKGHWEYIGIDSNKPDTSGPNRWLLQLTITNASGEVAQDVQADFSWTSSNPYIDLVAGENPVKAVGDMAPGDTVDVFYQVEVARDLAAAGTVRNYQVQVSGTNLAPVLFSDSRFKQPGSKLHCLHNCR